MKATETQGLLAGDTVVLRCPEAQPPTYLQDFRFSVLHGFSQHWAPHKATALQMSVHAGTQLAKYLSTSDRFPTRIELVPVSRRSNES
jgi:hypothetical protein